MLRKVLSVFKKADPAKSIRCVVAGISGGADSMAMLHVLHELRGSLGFKIIAAHLNHKLRGKESDDDARFVRKECRRLGVEIVTKSIEVQQLARERGISIEMAAREARYEFFKKTALTHNANAVLTAHTSDDQAETVLLKLARGAGSAGLAGIRQNSVAGSVAVIRPLLGVNRQEVMAYLDRTHAQWREDSSNSNEAYTRNRIRHKVLPVLEKELNPLIREALIRSADVLREESDCIEELALAAIDGCTAGRDHLDIARLKKNHRAVIRRVLVLWLSHNELNRELIDLGLINELEKVAFGRKANADVVVSGGSSVSRRYGWLIYHKNGVKSGLQHEFCTELTVPGVVFIRENGVTVRAVCHNEIIKERGTPGEYPARATVSGLKLAGRKITVRSWQPGDKIKPMGMRGSRKLKDIFIDLKIPAEIRASVPVFACGSEIVWLPGYRVAQGWEIGDASDAVLLEVAHT